MDITPIIVLFAVLLIFLRYANLIGNGSEVVIASIFNDLKFVGRLALSAIIGATIVTIMTLASGHNTTELTPLQNSLLLILSTFVVYEITQSLLPSQNKKDKISRQIKDAQNTIKKWQSKK